MSIARKVTLYVMLFSGLFTLLSSALQLYMDYENDLKGIDSTLALIDSSHIDSLANNIWNLDEELIATKLSEIMNQEDVVYLELKEPQAAPITKGVLSVSNRHIVRVYDLSERGARKGTTGSLTVTMTTENIYRRLRDKVFVILAIQSVKTLSVAIFIVFLFYMLVTRHIEKIRTFIAETATDPQTPPLTLEKGRGFFRRTTENDEFGVLVAEINSMRLKLNAGIEVEKASHEKLQQEINVRCETENELLILRNYLTNIIDSMPSILIGVDLNGNVTQWNHGAEQATGINAKAAVGQALVQSFPRLTSEMQRVYEAIESRQKQTILKRQYIEDGVNRYEDMTIYPLVANGIEGAAIRLDDITEKYANEIALRRAQKMESVGLLTGGIAHDFNNILGIVMGNLELLQASLSGNEKASARIEKALKGTQRGVEITRRLLRFSRNENYAEKRININEIIESMGEFITKSLTVSIDVQTHLSNNIWPVNVDPGDLEDAILNLSLNAKDAMPEGGTLIIETVNKKLDDGYVKCNPESQSGDFVMLSVIDNGIGVEEEVRDKIFEPFFTTKDQGKGTGLGLSMVYGFVKRSGGHMKIYSESGEGSTFHIFLPRSMEAIIDTPIEEYTLTDLPQGTESILIVDDEEALLDIATEYLKPLGYTVFTATSAKLALKVLEDNKTINLVFSDIIMPGDMDGYGLAETIHQDYPNYKILLASGFTKNRKRLLENKNHFILKLTKKRLYKPYNQIELAIAIRRTLDEEI